MLILAHRVLVAAHADDNFMLVEFAAGAAFGLIDDIHRSVPILGRPFLDHHIQVIAVFADHFRAGEVAVVRFELGRPTLRV